MKLKYLATFCFLACAGLVQAEESAAIEVPRLSTQDIMDILVSEKIITEQRAQELLQSLTAQKSVQQVQDDKVKAATDETALQPKVVRVPYVPEFVRDQIRDEVRLGLHDEVVNDIFAQAKSELWGVPGAMPEWTTRIKFSGDFRLRYQGDLFADQNALTGSNWYFDANEVNSSGELGTDASFFSNILEDRNRLRARLRLAMNARATEGVNVGMRLATGRTSDPVSTNQTMGNSNQPYAVILDRAFIKTKTEHNELVFTGGRMANPWLGTDLVWDGDLNFDGLAMTWRPLQSDSMENDERMLDAFVTMGAFPLDEVELSSKDKWLYGLQTGINWRFMNQNSLDLAIAYYDYRNIEGVRNEINSNLTDYTAPDLLATGNTLFNIANDSSAPDATLLALASDYDLASIYLHYNIARFAPVNVGLTLDYVKNIGYEQEEVLERTNGASGLISVSGNDDGTAHVEGYMIKLDLGWPNIRQRGNWQLSLAYRYLERDAVLDIFSDSDFRGGGTDNEGYIVQTQYALDDNTWMTLKLISADEIDGPPYGLETVQMDLNAAF
ncbi:MAG: hypothetical protein QG652_973 [Pseudomonadota bacterium]|nr:hypothetical protein [Pseudomonadota bacterium]